MLLLLTELAHVAYGIDRLINSYRMCNPIL